MPFSKLKEPLWYCRCNEAAQLAFSTLIEENTMHFISISLKTALEIILHAPLKVLSLRNEHTE
jgi:hypothetical protein